MPFYQHPALLTSYLLIYLLLQLTLQKRARQLTPSLLSSLLYTLGYLDTLTLGIVIINIPILHLIVLWKYRYATIRSYLFQKRVSV